MPVAVCLPLLLAALLPALGCEDEPHGAAGSEFRAPSENPAKKGAPLPSGQPQPLPSGQRPAEIGGRWQLQAGNRTFAVDLAVEDDQLRGTVAGSGDAPSPIKVGVFSGDAFLFETSVQGDGWLWSGQLSREGLQGQRENLQTGAIEAFTARRPE
jgi:hypothetical protein